MKYRVQCVRYGYAEVEAENEEAAVEIAETLPNSAYSWSSAVDHEVTGEVDG